MMDKLEDQLGPFLVVLWRIGPTGEDRAVRERVSVRLWMSGKRFGHETNFYQRLYAGLVKCVEDAVKNRPAVNWVSGRVFGVDIGRAPLQRGGAITGSEEIVDANVYRHGTEGGQLAEKLFAVAGVGVVWLIVAPVIPDWGHGSVGLISLHVNVHGFWSLLGS